MPPKDITETGPQNYRQIRQLNNFLTSRDRLEWIENNSDRLQNSDLTIGEDGLFLDSDIERVFRNTQFKHQFENDPKFNEYKKLSPEERDRMLLESKQNSLLFYQYGKNSQTVNQYGFPIKYKSTSDTPTQEEKSNQNIAAKAEELDEIYNSRLPYLTPASLRNQSEALSSVGAPNATPEEIEYEENRKQLIANRYAGDNGTKLVDDVKTLQEYAPNMSQLYKEFIDGNNEYIKSEDIPWEEMAPMLMFDIEHGDYDRASRYFNATMQRIMSKNQSFGEKLVNWNARFGANLGLMAIDAVGLLEGPVEALIGDIIVPFVSGEKIDWAQAGATALYDNFLANTSYDWQQSLRESMPVYASTGAPLLDPESSAFMASMFIPAGAVSKLGKGVSTVGKTGKSLSRAERFNKLTGYNRALNKADKELDEILSNVNNVNNRRLTELGQNAKYEALQEGKSLSQAQQEARRLQQEALTDIYRRGTIQKNQIRLSSLMEGQVEAIGADRASQENFEEAWDKQIRSLTTQALNGEIDLSDIPYNIQDADNYEQQLLNEGYLDEIIKHMKDNPESANYSDYEIEYAARQYLRQEAEIRARVDSYAANKKEDFQKLAKDQSNKAGMMTLLENYALLRVTEGLGGWTTRVPNYQRIKSFATEQKGFLNKTKEALGGITSFGSNSSQMMSRIKFNEAGRAVRRISPKSVAQNIGKIGGTVGIEVGQELGQELFTSGAEGTSAHNAEQFVLSHLAGPGREFVDDNYQSQLLSLFQHGGYGRTADDFIKIIKATGLQMLTGVPSVLKYRNRYSRVKDSKGKYHLQDNMRRGSDEKTLNYLWRNIESWIPMNSPVAQSITQVANTNTDVNTFIRVHNALLDDSQSYSGYAASSMNYAARAYDAAAREDEVDYEHNKFAAQTAEAIFLAQLNGKNRQTKLTYYQNLADINTKREGESEEDFRARQENTLNQLREEAEYNSIRNAHAEDLIEFAETNGKTMLEMVNKMSNKIQQLYEQYDGNITWEQLYATLYNDALVDYTNSRLNNIENIYKNYIPNIKNTEIKDDDRLDENKKPITIYNESELLGLNPIERNRVIEGATGKQKTIIDSLIKQLESLNNTNNLRRNVKNDFRDAAKESEIVQNASEEISRLANNPKQFLDSIRDKKARIAARKIFSDISALLSNNELDIESKRAQLSDVLSSLGDINNPQVSMALIAALNTVSAADSQLINSILTADRVNGRMLQSLVNELTKDMTNEEYVNSGYSDLIDKIQTTHISFLSDAIRTVLNEDEQKLLDNILQRYKEAQEINPHVEIEEGSTESDDNPNGEASNPNPISDEEFKQKNIDGIKAHLRIELDKLIQVLNISNPNELKESLESILSGEFDDINDVMLAINKEALHTEKSQLKTVLMELAKTLKDYNPTRVDNTRNLSTNKLSLADPTYFLGNLSKGNFAKYYKDYKIIELLRSGQIKVGTPIYVLWDSDFITETKKMYKESTGGEEATQNQIGLVAVVEGSFDGYPTITIGDKTYTRIGLFRAYGKGEHNSRDVVVNMISNVTTTPFDERGAIPDIENTIVTDKKGKPISFTITALNESALIPTPGVQNSAKVLSEERQNVLDSEADRTDEQGRQERAKQWFIDNLIIVTNDRGKHLPALKIDRHNTEGYSTIPIIIKNISDTTWQDTTVGQALRDRNIGLVSTVNGIPIFNRVATILKDFMTNSTVQPAIKSFLSDLDKLNKKKRISESDYKKKFEELLSELNKKCNPILNNRNGNSLYNRLSIPKDMEYYIDYITEVDEITGNINQYFTLGVKLEQGSHETAGNIEFMRYEAPAADGTTELITDERVVEALANLILDKDGEVRKSIGSNDEFVKWQLNYRDIDKRAGIADELLSDLYDMDVFLIETDNLISAQLDIDILPTDQSITKSSKPQAIEVEGNPDVDSKVTATPTRENDATRRVDLLQLHVTTDTTYTDQIQPIAQQFTWGRESVKLGSTPIRFIGLTESNDLTIVVDDNLHNDETKLAIIEELKKLGIPNADMFDFKSASDYNLKTTETNEGETITKKETVEDDISLASEMGARQERAEQPEVSNEEAESQAKTSIRNNLNNHWVEDLYDEELYNGEDADLDRLIDSLKDKYGSYQKAWETIRKISNVDELISIFKCS